MVLSVRSPLVCILILTGGFIIEIKTERRRDPTEGNHGDKDPKACLAWMIEKHYILDPTLMTGCEKRKADSQRILKGRDEGILEEISQRILKGWDELILEYIKFLQNTETDSAEETFHNAYETEKQLEDAIFEDAVSDEDTSQDFPCDAGCIEDICAAAGAGTAAAAADNRRAAWPSFWDDFSWVIRGHNRSIEAFY